MSKPPITSYGRMVDKMVKEVSSWPTHYQRSVDIHNIQCLKGNNMSDITNALLTFSNAEYEELRMEQVNALLDKLSEARNSVQIQHFEPVEITGGYKSFEAVLYGAALNHMRADDFIPYLYNVDWQYPKDVQLFLKHSDDDKFKVFVLDIDSYKKAYYARHGVAFV